MLLKNKKLNGFTWYLFWFVVVFFATFCVDIIYVVWPYPDGANGVEALRSTLEYERALISSLSDDRALNIINNVGYWLYQVFFVWSGIDELMQLAVNPAPLEGANEMMRSFVLSNWVFLETAAYGLQLFALRLGVLALALPLFLITIFAAGTDGVTTWYKRRTNADRETGFIYHRAKRAIELTILTLAVVYLIPPIPLDPRVIIPAFSILLALAARVQVAYFKKYV